MTPQPRGLGRGLGALIPQMEDEELSKALEVSIEEIQPNPYQPRKEFNQEKINELANSIKEHGIIQPLLVRKTNSGFQLIAGERRWRAAQMIELKTVPVVVRDMQDEQMMEIALVENLQRSDLNPIEEAEAYQRLMETFQLTQEDVAQKVGKSRPAVANTLRLLQLPEDIRKLLMADAITMGHARALLALSDRNKQRETCQSIIQNELSVRETEELIRRILQPTVSRETSKASSLSQDSKKNPHLMSIEDELKQLFGTKININSSGKRGKIEIEYYSSEELERVLEILLGKN